MSSWPLFAQKLPWFRVIGYQPTEAQLPIHKAEARHLLIGGGWRGGKSRATAMEAFACWPRWSLVYIVSDKYEQTTPGFDYLDACFAALEEATASRLVTRRQRPAHGQGRCTLELALGERVKRIVTISTHNQGVQAISARGEAPDMVLLVEFESLDYEVFLAARGRVAERRGRLILSGTFPDDTGWQADLWRRWQGDNQDDGAAFSLATWDNTYVFPNGWEDAEVKALRATYPESELMRRFGARPQKPSTLVFPEFDYAVHVRDFVTFDSALPVEVWVDPGYGESAYAVLAVQTFGGLVFVIDEIYEHGRIGEEIIELAKKRKWWDNVEGGVIDVAGRQHHAATSQIEVWRAKADVNLRSQAVSLEAGRDRLKSFLMKQPDTGEPRIFFSPKCKNTCAEFGKYAWRHAPEGRVAGEKPVDQHCDSIKALCYGLIDRFGAVEYPPIEPPTITPREQRWQAVFKQRR